MKLKFFNKIRSLINTKIKGDNNSVKIKAKEIIIEGNNNSIQSQVDYLNIKYIIKGNNNKIIIEEGVHISSGSIIVGVADAPTENCIVHIKKNTTSNGLDIILMEPDSSVIIGEDCMFSNNIFISCSDTHAILDDAKNVINIGKYIKIGNHVWCGYGVSICKNVEIADNSIIARGSIVTKSFDKPNVILAGVPAKIVKENVNWDAKRPHQYLAENS